ncbi:MAG: helix-turn-helix domain-containing protein [Candidatus Diapherotrites archaeon]
MEEILKEIGLNGKEVKIYLELLKERSQTASKIAKLTKINRTTAYLELENLMKLGLVSYTIKNSKRYYQPASPKKLVEILETKKKKIISILPKLESFQQNEELFKIEIYEGKEGLKTFYQDILNNAREVLAFGVTGLAFEILDFEFPHFIKLCEKKGIKARYIANKNSEKLLKKLPKNFVKIKYLEDKYNAKVTTIIYSNKVAIQSLQNEKIYITLIKDKNLYETYKNYFEAMWSC